MVVYETDKYFNVEGYEFGRYRDGVGALGEVEDKVVFRLNLVNVTQNLVFFSIGFIVTIKTPTVAWFLG